MACITYIEYPAQHKATTTKPFYGFSILGARVFHMLINKKLLINYYSYYGLWKLWITLRSALNLAARA
jgi:hypothetical protein